MNQQADLESNALRSEIDSTRGRMDQTIDALEDRMKGRHLIDEIVGFFRRSDGDGRVDELKQKISRTAGTVVDSVKAHPVPVMMVGAGIAWLIYQNRSSGRFRTQDQRNFDYTGEDYAGGYESYGAASEPTGYETEDYTGERVSNKSSSVVGQAKEKLSDLGAQAREKVANLGSRSREKLDTARQRVSELGTQAQQRSREAYARTRQQIANTTEQHPLEVGLGFLALGVIVGLAMPTPRAVSRRLEPVGTRVREAGSELVEKGKRVAQAATQAAKVEAKTQGLTVERVRDEARAVAKSAADAATETAKREGLQPGGTSPTDPTSARPPV
jgi:ElaB/YqjD/DUF883 family membrane-anchored ribosome-binding protein